LEFKRQQERVGRALPQWRAATLASAALERTPLLDAEAPVAVRAPPLVVAARGALVVFPPQRALVERLPVSVAWPERQASRVRPAPPG
jgi:hypothetical protein